MSRLAAKDLFHARARAIQLTPWAVDEDASHDTCIIAAICEHLELPVPKLEGEFAWKQGRKWRFDIYWSVERVAIEIDGATFARGRHTRGKGFEKDIEKRNAAVILGWKVLHFTTNQVRAVDYPLDILEKAKARWFK